MTNSTSNPNKTLYGIGKALQIAGLVALLCMGLAAIYLLITLNWLAILFLPYGWYFLVPIALISIGAYLKSRNK